MDSQLALLCALTFAIHFVGASAFAIRIAGVRTRRIGVSLSLFNVLLLVARISTSLQAPLLAKRIEGDLSAQGARALEGDLRLLLGLASVATGTGMALIPTTQRAFGRAIEHFDIHRSMPRLFLAALRPGGSLWAGEVFRAPSGATLRGLLRASPLPVSALVMNALAQAMLTVGVMASLYGGALEPELRLTSLSLAPMINGVAVIMMIVLVDPQLSALSDDVIDGRASEGEFRRAVFWLLCARLSGTALAQLALAPAALLTTAIARGL